MHNLSLHFSFLYFRLRQSIIMKRGLLLIILGIVTCATGVRAQYDAQLTHYFMAMGYYNPAVAGKGEDLNLFALHRQQWIGIKRAPKSFFIQADMPFKFGKTNHGLGLAVFTESIGLYNNTHVGLQYAYKQKLFGGVLSIGLQGGLVNQAFRGTEVNIGDMESEYHQQTDEAIPITDVEGKALDINAGIYYSNKHFYAGVAVMHVTEPEIELSETAHTFIGQSFNFTAGYNIKLKNPLYEVQPSVFLKSDLQTFQADVTARLIYNNRFNGGFSWRVNESVILLLGATFGRIDVGYAYDFPTTPILRSSSGSHELVLRYRLKINKTKTGKNRHKSVRIL